MPYTVSNTFSPLTPVGEAIQNVTRLMFSGPTQADRDKTALNAAHADYYRAQTDAARAKMAADEQARRDLADAPRRMVGQIFGNQQGADTWMAARQTGATPLAGFAMPDAEAGPMPQAPAAVPLQVDPNAAARAARLLTGIEAAKALPGNDNLGAMAKFLPALTGDELRQGAIGGAPLTPEQYANVGRSTAAMEGKPMFNNLGNAGVFDVFGGGQTLNGIGNAEVKLKGDQATKERALAGKAGAEAGAANALTGLRRAQTSEIGRLVEVVDPNTGQKYMVPEGKAGLSVLGRENKKDMQDNAANNAQALRDGKTADAKNPLGVKQKELREQFRRRSGLADDVKMDPAFEDALVARATQLAQERGGRYWNNPAAAGDAAWDEMVGGRELEDATGSFFDKNKRMAPPGFKKAAPAATPAQPAPAAPAPPKPGAVQEGFRFKGGNPADKANWEKVN